MLRRARFLSSDRTMYHGAMRVSVAFSMASRAREYSYHLARDGRSMALSFHWRSGSSMRALNRRSCSLLPTSSQNLISDDAAVDDVLLEQRAQLQEPLVLLVGAEPHHVLDAGAVVPAAIEDDDLAGGRKVLQCTAAGTSGSSRDRTAPAAPRGGTRAG